MRAQTNPPPDLATAAYPPRDVVVRRPALVDSLTEARTAALALLVAPPGYGKSTLLADWAEQDEREFVWLTPARGDLAAVLRSSSADGLARLVRRLRRQHESFVVVLDDSHLIAADRLCELIEPALAEIPAGSAIALASRTEPQLPTGRLRAHRLLSEIRIGQLAMDCIEADELLRGAGLELGLDEVEALVTHCEGWPAALYLAALANRGCADERGRFGGHHHVISEYLRAEILDPLPEELVEFAIRTSVLDELAGPICDLTLDRRGSAAALKRLQRCNPLLLPVDGAHHRYRWHNLMAETLRSELRRIEPELEPQLRLRASGWYSSHGDAQRAIAQAAAARDAAATGELLWRDILVYLTRGRNDLVRDWLANFSSEEIADHAALALSASINALVAGDFNEMQRWSLAAGAALARDGAGEALPSVSTGLVVTDAAGAHGGVSQMADASISAALTEPEDSLWRPLCSLLAGVGRHLEGERVAAEFLLDEAIRLCGSGAPMLASLGLAQRAMIAIEGADWELAGELTDRAVLVVQEWSLETDPLMAIVFSAAAAVRAHEGRVDEAKRDLHRGIDLLAELAEFVPWYGAEARILLAHASLWLADVVRARTLLAEASRFARRTPGAVIFSEWFEHAWAYMDKLAETSLAGPSSLTIAELRILRFLPSHRSFREIAAQLGVSSNTVKTQAHAVYRKLGAASRSEAVAQAIEAGLLGQ
jgi:LuxR family transcriptional regulator, maltose regulon positive regulatory protein